MARSYRPRAPSPMRGATAAVSSSSQFLMNNDEDSDNTYSIVQDSMRDRKMTQAVRIDRMFGDSANEDSDMKRSNVHLGRNNKFGSVSSNSTNSSSLRGGSLASIYQRKQGASSKKAEGTYDAATVEQIKMQFQAQIEAMMLSQERNNGSRPANVGKLNNGPIKAGHIPSAAEREVNGIRDIQRGKSFLEARTAVQKHIEKMLTSNNSSSNAASNDKSNIANNLAETRKVEVKHTMHGVSHAIPGELDDIEKPPPVHYGIDAAIRSGSVALKVGNLTKNRGDFLSNESLTTIIKEPSLSLQRGQSQESVVQLKITSSSSENSPQISPVAKKIIPLRNESPVEVVDVRGNNHSSPGGSRSTSAGLSSSKSPIPSAAFKAKEYVRHKVDYLGALPISASRSTNLAALQWPLKDLYFKWRALRNLGHSNLPGTLEINDNGLTVQYIRELHKGVQEIFNPFPTIAVWAAVKFVHKREVSEGGRMLHRYAFLPLISDPDGREKSRLFHDLESETEVELAADNPHPPVFACVMRKQGSNGAQKQLECHGFVCNTSEDAIIIAANLYQALLETMKKQKAKQLQAASSPARQKRSISKEDESISTYDSRASIFSETSTINGIPLRPPRRKKKNAASDSSAAGSILQRRRSIRSSTRSNRSARSSRRISSQNSGPVSFNPTGGPPSFVSDHPFRRSGQRLRRVDSKGKVGDFSRRSSRRSSRRKASFVPTRTPGFTNHNTGQGDVYTRVAIPRSKSFMNVNNQYNLQELFKELKEKEGVESIDDVLKKVISPNGISFNEIKPVYRELLLKLAMTMSQDELFQRSKNIMSQEKKKKKPSKKGQSPSTAASASEQSTLSSFLRLTFSSSKNAASNSNSSTTTHSQKKYSKTDISGPIPLHPPPKIVKTTRKATSPLPPTPSPPQNHGGKKPAPIMGKSRYAAKDDQVDDAYVSCSECGYESVCASDSCSCSSTAKAQHSRIPAPPKAYQDTGKMMARKMDDSDSVCDCDADSCISSEKCYCSLRKDPRLTEPSKSRPSLLPTIASSDSESCCHTRSSDMSDDTATDTTCYSVRHVPLTKVAGQVTVHNHQDSSLPGFETPQTAWRRNSRSMMTTDVSSDTYSDAGVILNSSASSSGAGSCKMCEIHHRAHHHLGSDDDDHSNLSRKNSGGSGYQSNDSTCCHSRPSTNSPPGCQCTSACSSCQTSLAGSLMSNRRSRPKLSLPVQHSHSHINLSAAGLGSPMERSYNSNRGRSTSPHKILVVSAMDKSGKLMYSGASNPNLHLMDGSSKMHHNHHSLSNLSNRNSTKSSNEEENNLMSMKKSAEIAAIFSGAKINQMTDIVDPGGLSTDQDSDFAPENHKFFRRQQYSDSNMHSSLGYFP